MKRCCRVRPAASLLTLALLGSGFLFPASAGAADKGKNEGQADLDKATELKLGAQTADELSDVIKLCETAQQKGIDKSNAPFANDLMAAALVERGSLMVNKIFGDESETAGRRRLPDDWQADRKQALADLEKGLKLGPKQPLAWFAVARLNLQLPGGDADKGMAALDKAISMAEDDPKLRVKALLLRAALRKQPQQRVADLSEAIKLLPGNAALLRERGLALAEDQKWDSAAADLDKAIAADPANVAAYLLKAAVLEKLKKYTEALAALDKAREKAPDNIELLVQKARIYSEQSNYKAAADQLTQAMEVNRSNASLLELRAAVYEQMGDKNKALSDVDKLLADKPHDPALLRFRATLLAELNRFDEAYALLQKLRAADPSDLAATVQLGILYVSMKKYEKAIAIYDEVLAKAPDELIAIRGRGDCLLNLGRRSEAVAEYEKCLKQQPHNVGVLNNFAWVLATAPEDNLRDGRRAVLMATDACNQTEFKEDYILSTLAAAYAETGDFASARKYATQAIDAKPSPDAEADRKDELKKELASYEANKPWREALPDTSAKATDQGPAKKAEKPAAGDSKAADDSKPAHKAKQ